MKCMAHDCKNNAIKGGAMNTSDIQEVKEYSTAYGKLKYYEKSKRIFWADDTVWKNWHKLEKENVLFHTTSRNLYNHVELFFCKI